MEINQVNIPRTEGFFFSVLQIPADIEEFILLLKNVFLGELISGKHNSIQAVKAPLHTHEESHHLSLDSGCRLCCFSFSHRLPFKLG